MSLIQRFCFKELRIPFKVAFRHAAAERNETSSVWVEAFAASGAIGYGESCPRPYVTGETLETAGAFFLRHEQALRAQVVSLDSLRAWMAVHTDALDANPAAWCAIELAIVDLLAKERARTVEALLELPPLQGRFQYSAVLGDAETEAFRSMAERYRRWGFADFKVKLSGRADRDRDNIDTLRRWGAGAPRIRLDANNLWETADDAIDFIHRLEGPFFAIEEPIRKNQYAALAHIAKTLGCRVVLDESFLRIDQLPLLEQAREHYVINLRVSKMGGLLRSLAVLDAARARGIGLIIGAQVGETSLLTRAALSVAHAAGEALIAQEGAFGTYLLEHDVCEPPLMFGAGGVLDASSFPMLSAAGFGVAASAS